MLRRLIRHVRDTFAAGNAERRFKELERETRELITEIDHALNKWAIKAATESKQRSRAAAKAIEATAAAEPTETTEETVQSARAQWKAQQRAKLAGRFGSSQALNNQMAHIEPPPAQEEQA